MPPAAFTEAFEWTWEDFAGYREAIERTLAINVAPLVGHSVIRLWVMGDAAQTRAATASEISAMQDLLRACLAAGAVGLSTSFVDVDENLRPVPSRFAHLDELDGLAQVLGEYGRILQVVPEFYATDLTIARVDQLAELSLRHDIPTTFSPLFDSKATPENVPRTMARVDAQFARGARVWPQVQTRPIDISFSFDQPSLFGRFPPGIASCASRAERIGAARWRHGRADGRRNRSRWRPRAAREVELRGGEGAPDHSSAARSPTSPRIGATAARALIGVSRERSHSPSCPPTWVTK
jgi:N-acyl-D-aspartate/D-glutamate deacylase